MAMKYASHMFELTVEYFLYEFMFQSVKDDQVNGEEMEQGI
jgi:hypothetical protein